MDKNESIAIYRDQADKCTVHVIMTITCYDDNADKEENTDNNDKQTEEENKPIEQEADTNIETGEQNNSKNKEEEGEPKKMTKSIAKNTPTTSDTHNQGIGVARGHTREANEKVNEIDFNEDVDKRAAKTKRINGEKVKVSNDLI